MRVVHEAVVTNGYHALFFGLRNRKVVDEEKERSFGLVR